MGASGVRWSRLSRASYLGAVTPRLAIEPPAYQSKWAGGPWAPKYRVPPLFGNGSSGFIWKRSVPVGVAITIFSSYRLTIFSTGTSLITSFGTSFTTSLTTSWVTIFSTGTSLITSTSFVQATRARATKRVPRIEVPNFLGLNRLIFLLQT